MASEEINRSNRLRARDRRMVAVHEAGHVVVARILNLEIMSAWIVPNDGDDTERTWVGRAQIANVRNAGDLVRRMVGCAGAVAELCWRGEFVDPDYWTEPEMMSPSIGAFPVASPANRMKRFGMLSMRPDDCSIATAQAGKCSSRNRDG